MGISKGTKLTDSPKNQMVRVRMDEDTVEKLNYLANRKQVSKSEIIRNGIAIQYEQQNKK
jgi:predicted transcriptional regulator